MSPSYVLAATLGMDLADMKDCRYQPGRTPHAVWTVGDDYYCVRPHKPSALPELDWQPFSDQHWAKLGNTVVWFAKCPSETPNQTEI